MTSLSGSAASGYSIPSSGNTIGKLIINPLALNLTGSRIYDGTAGVQGNSLVVNNRVGNDVVTLSGTGTLSSADAGVRSVTSLGTLSVSNPNYTLTGASSAYTINPLAVTLTGSKTYDGTIATDGSSLSVSNRVGNDVVTVGGTGANALNGSKVGARDLISFAGLSLSNANYTLTGASGSVTINPRVVTLSGSKIYDGLTSVQGTALTAGNLVGNDFVTVGGTGTLASANAGNQSLTSTANLTLSDGNYTLVGASGSVTIVQRGVTLSGSKVYDGSTSVSAAQMTVGSVLQGDTVTLAGSGSVRLPGVGQQSFRTSNFTLSNPNYAIGSIAALNITPRPVILTGTQQYDGTTTVQGTSLGVSNLVQGDTVTVGGSVTNSVSSAAASPVPQNLLKFDGLTLSNGNYTLTGGSGSVTIAPRAVTLSGGKFYDGTTTVAGNNLQVLNTVGQDSVNVTGTITNGIADPNASSTAKSLLTLSGLSLSNTNYTLDGGSGVYTVSKALVSLSGAKVYDGTTSVQGSMMTVNSVVPGETVTVTGSGTLSSSNVGTWSFTSGAFALSSSNYSIINSGQVVISPRPVVLSGSKTYNGSTSVAGSALSVSNAIPNDVVALGGNGSATLASANAGSQVITALGNFTLSNPNYTMTGASGSVTVAPRPVSLFGSKTYDGTTTVSGTALTVANRIGNDVVTVGGTGTATSADVGNWGWASVTNLTLSNSNYTVTGATGFATINPRPVTLSGSKAYDSLASVQGSELSVSNAVGNDVVTVGGSASLGSRGAGNALISSFGNLTLSNPNYTTTGAFGLVKINPRVVTLSGAKTYDGLASVDGIVLTAGNLVGSDLVTVGGTGTLASANAGSQSLTSTANLTLSNANYTLVGASGSVTINPRVVTLSGSKIYDGLTSVQGIVLTAGNLAGNDVVTVGGTGTLASANAGNQALTSLAGLTLSNANYTLTGASGAVTVTPRPVTLAGNKTYDGLASVPGTMLSVSNLAGNDAVTVGGIGTLASANAGKQAVTSFSNLTLSNTNYTLTGASGSVTIAPRAVTLAGSKTYDGTTTVAGSSLTLLNLVQGDAVSVGGSIANALASPNVGQQNLLALNGLTLSSNNYTLAGGSGSLMVTPRAITITADSQSRAAGQPNPPLSFAITAGTLANGDAFTGALATAATAVSVPGTYSIDQGTLSASRNYTLTYVPGIIVVTVNPALAGSPLGQLTPVNFAPQGAGGQNPQVVCDASAIAGKLRSTGSAPLSTFSASGCGQ